MKITFLADKSPRAMQALFACIKRYGQSELGKADVVIALGGDGFLLKTLQALLNYQTPVFGLNFGHVGYLLNNYTNDDLTQRVDQAERVSLTPLSVKAEPFYGKPVEAYAFNDFSLMRQSPQAARLSVIITDDQKGQRVVRQDNVFGDGVVVATSSGSSGYYASAGGRPLTENGSVGVKGVCCKIDYNPILSENGHIVVAPQEPKKRPIHLDCDGKRRFNNIAIALVESDSNKKQTLLLDRKKCER